MLAAYLEDRNGKVDAFKRLQEAARPLRAQLGSLRPDQVDDRRWARYAAGRAVSAGTLRRERNVLVAALNLARRHGWIAQVPAIKPPPAPPPRDRYLTREEAARLIDAMATPHARLLYTVMIYTGARRGAVLDLTWDRVDFRANRIDFRLPGKVEHAKRRAVVPMGPKLRAAMEAAAQAATCAWVIEWEGERCKRVRWPFHRARIRAGLGPEVTPHVLRHSAASWLAMGRVPIDEAADLLACDPGTLRRVYRHFDPAYLDRAVRTLEDTL
ncbi:MAG: site-specific integrase [Pseudomonadales bacterium]|nr:site-specific integrase [Pseudomonadales bacterium]